jgi:hypothetical protein
MRKPTLLKTLLAGIASLALIGVPQAAFAQRGGHGGGGGGSHAGSAGGGFHGSSAGGGFHGSSAGGGFHGSSAGSGYRGGERATPSYRGGDRFGRMGEGSPAGRNSGSTRSSSSVPRADTSPGWHSFGRSGSGVGPAAAHQMGIADGQWHSFGSAHGAAGPAAGPAARPALAANARFGQNNFFTRGRGFGGGGFGGWRGSWGYPGYGFGWGCWGCGFGFGWDLGWSPFWAVYPYPYWDSLWWGDPYDYYPPPSVLYPYPD